MAVIAFADARREPPVECAQCRVGPSNGYGSKSQKRRGPAPRPRRPVRETSCRPCASSRPAAGRALKGRSGSRRSSLPCPAPRAVPPEPCAPPRSAASCSSPPRVHRWRRRSARVRIARAGENCARRSNVTIASARVPRPPGLAAAGSTNCHTVSIPLPSNCISVPPGKPNTFMSKGIGAAPPVDRHRRLRGLFGLPGSFAVAGSYAPPEVDSGSLNGAPRHRTPRVVFERSCPSIACGLGVTPAQNSPRRCDLRPKPTIRSVYLLGGSMGPTFYWRAE